MALILELLHPDGTRSRRRLDGSPMVLGRALSSDIVLDDPYVDGRHARIEPDASGALAIEDLASVNGVIAGAAGRQQRLLLHPGTELRIGRTVLRIRDEDEPVPPALVDAPAAAAALAHSPAMRPAAAGHVVGDERWMARIARWTGTSHGRLAISGAAVVSVALYAWQSSYDRSTASDVLAGTLVFVFMAAMWAGIWAIASRVATQRFNFVGHLAIVSAITIAGMATFIADEWYSFFVPQSAMSGIVTGFVALALLSAMIAWHLSLSSRMPRDHRWRAGILVSVTLVAIGGLFALVEDETFTDVPTFPGVVKPVGAGWLPTSSVEDFGAVIADLKEEVDDLAASRPSRP